MEIQFYLLVVLLLLLGCTRRRLLSAAAWVPALCTLLILLIPRASGAVTFLGFAPLFAAGIVLHVLHHDGHTLRRWLLLAFTTAQAAVLAAVEQAPALAHLVSEVTVSATVLAAVVVGCVGLVAVTALVPFVRDVDRQWLTWAGTLTYPLYLTHEYVGWALIEAVHPHAGRWVTLAVTVTGCLVLAWVIHHVVERPVQHPLRAWLEARLTWPGPRRAAMEATAAVPRKARARSVVSRTEE